MNKSGVFRKRRMEAMWKPPRSLFCFCSPAQRLPLAHPIVGHVHVDLSQSEVGFGNNSPDFLHDNGMRALFDSLGGGGDGKCSRYMGPF